MWDSYIRRFGGKKLREFLFDDFYFLCEIGTWYQPVRVGLEMVYKGWEEQREAESAADENGNEMTEAAYGSYETYCGWWLLTRSSSGPRGCVVCISPPTTFSHSVVGTERLVELTQVWVLSGGWNGRTKDKEVENRGRRLRGWTLEPKRHRRM